MVFQQKECAALGKHCWGKPLVGEWGLGWGCTAEVVAAVVEAAAAAAAYSPSELSGALQERKSD